MYAFVQLNAFYKLLLGLLVSKITTSTAINHFFVANLHLIKYTPFMEFEPGIVKEEWEMILDFFENSFGKRPSEMEPILLMIGVQELGQGHAHFTKEQKQDLLHIATCKVLSYSDFYRLEGLDEEGWPHWENVQGIPSLPLKEQEILLKAHIIHYFKTEVFPNEDH
jgi:hypothetical protein